MGFEEQGRYYPTGTWGDRKYIVLSDISLQEGPQMVLVVDITGRDDIAIRPYAIPEQAEVFLGEGKYAVVTGVGGKHIQLRLLEMPIYIKAFGE